MSSIVIKGDTSGQIEIAAPAVAGSNTLTLPATTGTILDTNSSLPAANLTGTIAGSVLPVGSILQVVQSVKTDTFSTTSTSYVDITGLTVSITPSSTSSKILIMYNTSGGIAGDIAHGYINIFRDGTELVNVTSASNREGGMNVFNVESRQQPSVSGHYLDSPSSTSSLTYQIKLKSSNGSTMYINRSHRDTDNSQYDGRSLSIVTVMEVAG